MFFTNLTRAIEIGANSYLLEAAEKKVVIDCGMHPKIEGDGALPLLNLTGENSVDAILLSHAHQDHVGSIPVVMRRHPRAPLFSTEATRQLADVMLHNSVHVMGRRREEGGPANYPMFTHRELDAIGKRWTSCPLHQRISVEGERLGISEESDMTFEFFDAGHVLGAAGTLIRAEERTVFYTGDVNFEDQSISAAARFPQEGVDVLIMETTRGDHPIAPGFTRAAEAARLAAAIGAAFERGGSVLMPLFALGKTQELLTMFHAFRAKRILARCPIYIGGLSTKLTELYDRLAHAAPRLQPDLQILEAVAPFVVSGRNAVLPPPGQGRIFALSSGMMTEKTLSNSFARNVISDPSQTMLFVGYADPNSPAGKLRAARQGDMVTLDPAEPSQPLLCHVEPFNLSGHASRESLREFAQKLRPKKIILVHGDPPAVEWFRSTLSADLPGTQIISPASGVRIAI